MTEETNPELPSKEEYLGTLKKRADLLGISYHHKAGIAKLEELLSDKQPEPEDLSVAPEPEVSVEKNTTGQFQVKYKPETERQRKMRLRKDASKLIRGNVVCNNPRKTEYTGDYHTGGNSLCGFQTKFIQYNTVEGYHIPNAIYKVMVESQCQIFYTGKDRRGNPKRIGKLIKEFNIEVLPNLTKKELSELGERQLAANSLSED